MIHPHLPQDRIWPFVTLLTLLFASTLPAQNKLDQLTDSLKQNVIAIKVLFTDDSEEKGFGFITGEQNGRLFLATAAHVVRGIDNDQTAKSIKVRFFNDYRWFDAAFIRHWDDNDLALLEINKPIFVRWKQDCADFTPEVNSKVRFIGLNRNEPIWVDTGLEGKIFSDDDFELNFAISTIRPGTSGAPLITERGIVGMVVKDDADISIALKLKHIQKLINQNGQYEYFRLHALQPMDKYDLIFIKGGSFNMGCTDEQGEDCFDEREKPIHKIIIADFYISKYEVTQEQWIEIMDYNPSDTKGCNKCPVEQVSWQEVEKFIAKINEKTGKKYRLPTEEEWEFAARGGNVSKGFKYSGSNNIDDVAWYGNNSDFRSHPVGTKQPNELGIYDMTGNVYEWCQDWYESYLEKNNKGIDDPKMKNYKIIRGGAWGFPANTCHISARGISRPTSRENNFGFRLALTLTN